MEMDIILANLEKFERWNQIFLIMNFHHVKRSLFHVLRQW